MLGARTHAHCMHGRVHASWHPMRSMRSMRPMQVSAVHKANIMKKADGLFLECCREVGGYMY